MVRSISIRKLHSNIYAHSGSKKQCFKRSSSSSQLSNNDPFLTPKQLFSQELKMESLETNHFILVHGRWFWCPGVGSGANSCDINTITSLEQYIKPLIEFCNKLGNKEKVILVGHDFRGACI
ncbi:hypothetical protein Pint_23511 [Pistacia integerrima]|uniref:Uncharacterized protein n=1 Tax=Pistacia integerrima TaxID=434235 RepID=A0ACC0YKZ3_9ROSI|nr:hypothetical protein Pint_23511 [Pistacia integerrima]